MKNRFWPWVIIVLGVVVAVRQGSSVWRLWKSGEQIKQAQAQVRQEEDKNQSLKARLAEIDTPEFIEKEAREKLGYSKAGETILILPKLEEPSSAKASEGQAPNWRRWWDLYIRI